MQSTREARSMNRRLLTSMGDTSSDIFKVNQLKVNCLDCISKECFLRHLLVNVKLKKKKEKNRIETSSLFTRCDDFESYSHST